ncbi:MAG: 1-acyl-sn-glycerol-3-phosphate acyltransferase [Deltaproteobacteria bacterium]|nr:1-acyl-sn-glycerol-3-phosphate acyltransferase [Deltaproteobacteria bacterium]
MNRVLRILYQPYKFLIFAPVVILSTFIIATIAVGLAAVAGPKAAGKMGIIWSRINAWATPMPVTVQGRENINKEISCVVVSNHQSQYDIFVLYGWLGIDFKWVMKQELRNIPGLGIACEKIGHIFIDRSNTQAALDSINAAREKIVNGTSVLFFPEGTRSKSAKMGTFKKGAFRFALDLGLPILPVTIQGTRKILPASSFDLFPGRAIMIIHPLVDTSGYSDETLPDLMDAVRKIIASDLPEEPVAQHVEAGRL